MVRAGWSLPKFSASKLNQDDSTSGPSATSQPIATNTSAMRSPICVIGCRAPRGRRSQGSVTSTASSASTRASRSSTSTARRASNASCTSCRAALTRLPASARSGPGSEPSSRRASRIGARSPRCAGRTAASSARSDASAKARSAAATAAFSASGSSRLCRSVLSVAVLSVMVRGILSATCCGTRVEADGGRGGQVEALGAAVDRDPHAVVGPRRDGRRARRAPRRRRPRPPARRAPRRAAGSCRSSSPCASATSRVSPAAAQASSTAAASRSRASGRWKTLPVEARTALPLCGSTVSPASSTASAPAASATRITVPTLPGSAMPAQTATSDGRAPSAAASGDVEQVADRHEALRGDGVGQRLGGPVGDRADPGARVRGGGDQLGVPVGGRGRDEQLAHPAAYRTRLADRLRPLHEEPPGPIAPRAAQQLAGCDDARGAFGAGRCVGRERSASLRSGRRARLGGARSGRARWRGRARRAR